MCFSPIHSDRQSAGSSIRSMFDHTTVESTAMVEERQVAHLHDCRCNQRKYDPVSGPVEAEEFYKGS